MTFEAFFTHVYTLARFERNEFAEKALKLGIPLHARLTRRQWAAVRRKISPKPRRFSRAFIREQLQQRNKYRRQVRRIQRDPSLLDVSSFPYNVPWPIAVGRTVTAYSRKYLVLHRGMVLAFDYKTATYVIKFEGREFGCEVCPDSEVATHGGAEELRPWNNPLPRMVTKTPVAPKPFPVPLRELKGYTT